MIECFGILGVLLYLYMFKCLIKEWKEKEQLDRFVAWCIAFWPIVIVFGLIYDLVSTLSYMLFITNKPEWMK